VIGIQCSERNGALVAATQVTEAHELMLISNQGTLVRTRVAEVSQLSRNTQGVTLIKLPADEKLVSVMRLDAEEENGDEGEIVGGSLPVEPNDSGDVDPTPAED
jgi:DNA gyrase subunit A